MQCFGGIVTVSVGHCHPRVVEAINRQNELLQHTTTIYLNHQVAEYAKELVDTLPGNLKVDPQNGIQLNLDKPASENSRLNINNRQKFCNVYPLPVYCCCYISHHAEISFLLFYGESGFLAESD